MNARTSLACLVNHLDLYYSLANTSMVDFIVSDMFSTLPDIIQLELLGMDDEDIAAIPTKLMTGEASDTPLGKMVAGLKRHSLEELGLVKDWDTPTDDDDYKIDTVEFLDKIMPEKKMHEVLLMSKFVSELSACHGVTSLVDMGSGKGYLSQLLSAWYRLPVLALDYQVVNTRGAERRGRNLADRWEGLVVRAGERKKGKTPSNWKQRKKKSGIENTGLTKGEDGDTLLVNLTQFVDSGSDIGDLVKEHLETGEDMFGIIGLHTCGDLAAASIRTFLSSSGAKVLCNVGCCYRPLTEQFSDEQSNKDQAGFPLSSYLRSASYSLGRLARTLSSQPLPRLASAPSLPDRSLLWRAVLQAVAAKVAPDLTWQQMKVGNTAAKCETFLEYARTCFNKIGLELAMSDQQLVEMYQDLAARFGKKLNAFYQLRALIAPLIESIILVDRLVYLQEETSVKECYLVKLFDSTISPRSYAVVAIK